MDEFKKCHEKWYKHVNHQDLLLIPQNQQPRLIKEELNFLIASYIVSLIEDADETRDEDIKRILNVTGISVRKLALEIEYTDPISDTILDVERLDRVELDDSRLTLEVDEDEPALAKVLQDDNIIVFVIGNHWVSFALLDLLYYVCDKNECFFECVPGVVDRFDYETDAFISLPTHLGAYHVPRESLIQVVRGQYKIVHIVPRLKGGVHWKVELSASYQNSHGGDPDWVSNRHCQEGTDFLVYDFVKCTGSKCLTKSAILSVQDEEGEDENEDESEHESEEEDESDFESEDVTEQVNRLLQRRQGRF